MKARHTFAEWCGIVLMIALLLTLIGATVFFAVQLVCMERDEIENNQQDELPFWERE